MNNNTDEPNYSLEDWSFINNKTITRKDPNFTTPTKVKKVKKKNAGPIIVAIVTGAFIALIAFNYGKAFTTIKSQYGESKYMGQAQGDVALYGFYDKDTDNWVSESEILKYYFLKGVGIEYIPKTIETEEIEGRPSLASTPNDQIDIEYDGQIYPAKKGR